MNEETQRPSMGGLVCREMGEISGHPWKEEVQCQAVNKITTDLLKITTDPHLKVRFQVIDKITTGCLRLHLRLVALKNLTDLLLKIITCLLHQITTGLPKITTGLHKIITGLHKIIIGLLHKITTECRLHL